MISVKRYFQNIPEILTSEDVNRSVEALLKNDKTVDPGIYTHHTVREALKKIYHDKCAYCESGLKNTGDTDHYRPVDKYPWLAYEWSNLLPVCPDCKKSKASQFPIRGSRVETASAGDGPHSNTPVLKRQEYLNAWQRVGILTTSWRMMRDASFKKPYLRRSQCFGLVAIADSQRRETC